MGAALGLRGWSSAREREPGEEAVTGSAATASGGAREAVRSHLRWLGIRQRGGQGFDGTAASAPVSGGAVSGESQECHDLQREIKEINDSSLYAILSTQDDSADSVLVFEEPRGTVIRCSLRFHTPPGQTQKFWHLWLLIPTKYPDCSPIILENISVQLCEEPKDSFLKALSIFSTSVLHHPKPTSLKQIVRLWELSAKEVATEIARQIKDRLSVHR